MDPREHLLSARQAGLEGNHEEALRGFIWFHEHALEHDPAYYGVRLSFALGFWLELGEVYPKAIDALKEIRDNKTQILLMGNGDRELFHDVEAINESLEEGSSTYELFKQMVVASPALAQDCAELAMRAIVKCGDYSLAHQYMGDPYENIREWSRNLNEDVADIPSDPAPEAPVLDAYEQIFADRVNLLTAVLAGVGQVEEAVRARNAALEAIESAIVRDSVRVRLSPPAS